MLMLDTIFVVIDVNNAIREITSTLLSDSDKSLTDRYNQMVLPWPVENVAYAFMVRPQDLIVITLKVDSCAAVELGRCHHQYAHGVICSAQCLTGSSFVVWRACVFWGGAGERWALMLPLASLLGSVGTSHHTRLYHTQQVSDHEHYQSLLFFLPIA